MTLECILNALLSIAFQVIYTMCEELSILALVY